jgi:predicted nucleic acid-binding protein
VKPAFWDTSALVPLCLKQQPSSSVHKLLIQHDIAVWWATPVEIRSAFERLLRMRQVTAAEHAEAGAKLEKLRRGWRELQPTEALRAQAESFLKRYPLRAADALQLAAAWIWCAGHPQTCVFISADAQLLEAAQQAGFMIAAV